MLNRTGTATGSPGGSLSGWDRRLPARLVLRCTVLVCLLAAAACTPEVPSRPAKPTVRADTGSPGFFLDRIDFAALPGWTSDRTAEALPSLARSCAALTKQPSDRRLTGAAQLTHRAGAWRPLCRALAQGPYDNDAEARDFVARWFIPYRVRTKGGDRGLFTGYFIPDLRGARRQSARFQTPLYRLPPDLVRVDLGAFLANFEGRHITGRLEDGRLEPYYSRAEIVAGALAGRDLELLWVEDPIAAFFLQIQGSGRVTLPDGGLVRVGYAGQNGHPYFAIGTELIRRGVLTRETVSLQSIDAWLRAHPREAPAVMNLNASYVFFRALDGPIVGAQGVPLTPGRSLAVDRAYYPLGLPVWIDVQDSLDATARVRRLMVAQDTGGAIKGAIRGDVFWGHGAEAKRRAGPMKSEGRMVVLLPRFIQVEQ